MLSRISLRRWLLTLLFATATGALSLGVGGRLVMRLFALATARPPAFSLRGTLVVTLAGAAAGAVGGLLFMGVRRFLPARLWLRGVVFGALCYGLASPGFRPPWPLVFALFAPGFIVYGLGLVLFERRCGEATV